MGHPNKSVKTVMLRPMWMVTAQSRGQLLANVQRPLRHFGRMQALRALVLKICFKLHCRSLDQYHWQRRSKMA